MSKHRAGTGGVTPTNTRRETLLAAAYLLRDAINHGHTHAAAATYAQPVLDALGLDLTTLRHGPQPSPQPAATPAPSRQAAEPGEPLPDVLTPRQAATIARRYTRHGQAVPPRVARLTAEYQQDRKAAKRTPAQQALNEIAAAETARVYGTTSPEYRSKSTT